MCKLGITTSSIYSKQYYGYYFAVLAEIVGVYEKIFDRNWNC